MTDFVVFWISSGRIVGDFWRTWGDICGGCLVIFQIVVHTVLELCLTDFRGLLEGLAGFVFYSI